MPNAVIPQHRTVRSTSRASSSSSFADFANELLEEARGLSSGRSARTLTPQVGVTLKQTLMALLEGRKLDEHRAPNRATIQVLRGSLSITAGDQQLDLSEGSWSVIPDQEHDLEAHTDSVVLLTVGQAAND